VKIPVMHFCPTFSSFYLGSQNGVLSTIFSSTLSLCPTLTVTDQVSHPYKTTNNIRLLYAVIFLCWLTTENWIKRF